MTPRPAPSPPRAIPFSACSSPSTKEISVRFNNRKSTLYDSEDNWEDAVSILEYASTPSSSGMSSRQGSFNSFNDRDSSPPSSFPSPPPPMKHRSVIIHSRRKQDSADVLALLGLQSVSLLQKLETDSSASSSPDQSPELPPKDFRVFPLPPSSTLKRDSVRSARSFTPSTTTTIKPARVASFSSTDLAELDVDALLAAYDQLAREDAPVETKEYTQTRRGTARRSQLALSSTSEADRSSSGSEEMMWESFIEKELLVAPKPASIRKGPFPSAPETSTFPSKSRASSVFPTKSASTSSIHSVRSTRSQSHRPEPLTFSHKPAPSTRTPLSPIISSPLSPAFLPTAYNTPLSTSSSPTSPTSPPMRHSPSHNSSNSVSSASSSRQNFRWSSTTSGSASTVPSTACSEDEGAPRMRRTSSVASSVSARDNCNPSKMSALEGHRFVDTTKFGKGVSGSKKSNLGQLHRFTPTRSAPISPTRSVSSLRRNAVNFKSINEDVEGAVGMNEEVNWSNFLDGFYGAPSPEFAEGTENPSSATDEEHVLCSTSASETDDSRTNSEETVTSVHLGASSTQSSPAPSTRTSLDHSRLRRNRIWPFLARIPLRLPKSPSPFQRAAAKSHSGMDCLIRSAK